jgi:hypothetical protein
MWGTDWKRYANLLQIWRWPGEKLCDLAGKRMPQIAETATKIQSIRTLTTPDFGAL